MKGVQIELHEEGEGETVPKGTNVTVHYTGKLEDGSVFDSSVTRGTPFTF
jgi:FKBP-type peptidyl-prolyl cis-trans isomerase